MKFFEAQYDALHMTDVVGGAPSGVPGFCLPSTSKFSMLDATRLTMNQRRPGVHTQASPFRPVLKPAR
jgi:hypothetical protein